MALSAGSIGAKLRNKDTVEYVMSIMDHDHLLFFTDDGSVRSVRGFHIPQGSRTAIGSPISQVCDAQQIPPATV